MSDERFLELIDETLDYFESESSPWDMYERSAVRPFVRRLKQKIEDEEDETGEQSESNKKWKVRAVCNNCKKAWTTRAKNNSGAPTQCKHCNSDNVRRQSAWEA